jgi:methylated-DNA-[protein]-cysteine S-methyltransferase
MQSTIMMSPLGQLVLAACDDGLLEVRLPAPESPLPRVVGAGGVLERAAGVGGGLERAAGTGTDAILGAARQQLAEYFAGRRRAFELPLDVRGTEFDRSVWEALGAVAYGDTVTYGQLARSIGHPRAARAVGAALGRNPLAIVVPCHRVVAAGGGLGGFGGGLARKRLLLAGEAGAPVAVPPACPASRSCRHARVAIPRGRQDQSVTGRS